MMDEHGKSDKPILPEKSRNKAGTSAAEGMEGRGLAKGNGLHRLGRRSAIGCSVLKKARGDSGQWPQPGVSLGR